MQGYVHEKEKLMNQFLQPTPTIGANPIINPMPAVLQNPYIYKSYDHHPSNDRSRNNDSVDTTSNKFRNNIWWTLYKYISFINHQSFIRVINSNLLD